MKSDFPKLDELKPYAEFAEATGLSRISLWRAIRHGQGAHRLRAVRLGKKLLTCEQWILEYAARVEEQSNQRFHDSSGTQQDQHSAGGDA